MNKPQKIALLSTEFHPASHTDVIVSRWLAPFPTDSLYGWQAPEPQIASFYIAQRKMTSDLAAAASLRHGIPCFESISEALTLGGDQLAVDAVFLIAEHGNYPENEFHQKLYPRKEFFDEVLKVFKKSGRVVPVFFDKHLSWNPEWIQEMFQEIKDLKIPFFAGSSAPYSLPESLKSLPPDQEFEEVVAVYYNALESYFFHSAEIVEVLLEQRHTTNPGLVEITAWEGEAVWEAIDRGEFSWDLVEAACASSTEEHLAAIREHRKNRGTPVYAFKMLYSDGLKVTHFMQRDVVRKHCQAVKFVGQETPVSGTGLGAGAEHYFPHFARFCRQIEDFLLSGKSPIPVTRIYNSSMNTALAMRALAQPGKPFSTGDLTPERHTN